MHKNNSVIQALEKTVQLYEGGVCTARGAAEGGAAGGPPRGDGEGGPAGPDIPRAAETPTVVLARPSPGACAARLAARGSKSDAAGG